MIKYEWNIKVYLNDKTIDVISEWLNGLPLKDRAKIRTRINYLRTIRQWPKSYCKKYVPYKHIYELRIQYRNSLYRPLGFFGPGGNKFTLLIGAREKGDRIEPLQAPNIAEERRKLILQDGGYIDDFV